MDSQNRRKPRLLCLHGFGSNVEIFKKKIEIWPEVVLEKLDLEFLEAPFPVQENSEWEGHYTWFYAHENFTEYENFDECVAYIEDYMIKAGPFDGVLGFSQGALLTAAFPGMQAQGASFSKVPKIKFIIVIAGGKFGGEKFSAPKLAENAFASPIECPSLHFIGEKDTMAKEEGIALLESFADPVVIYHPEGHTVPKLEGENLEKVLKFIENIQITL